MDFLLLEEKRKTGKRQDKKREYEIYIYIYIWQFCFVKEPETSLFQIILAEPFQMIGFHVKLQIHVSDHVSDSLR